ncbi:MAG: hypothetical protein R3D46_01055 [Defluviimonas denitrificans]
MGAIRPRRMAAYEYGGFWSGFCATGVPTYPGQAFAMFATPTASAHGGLSHLALNMVTLIVFGSILAQRAVGGARC